MIYKETDFFPAETPMMRYTCGCDGIAPLVVCKIIYVDEKQELNTVCFRQQCQECGFVRKNRIGKNLYWSVSSGKNLYNFLPEFFWAPEDVIYDSNMQYNRNKKLDFVRRILTLANRNASHKGNLEFTKEEIYKLDLTKR